MRLQRFFQISSKHAFSESFVVHYGNAKCEWSLGNPEIRARKPKIWKAYWISGNSRSKPGCVQVWHCCNALQRCESGLKAKIRRMDWFYDVLQNYNGEQCNINIYINLISIWKGLILKYLYQTLCMGIIMVSVLKCSTNKCKSNVHL